MKNIIEVRLSRRYNRQKQILICTYVYKKFHSCLNFHLSTLVWWHLWNLIAALVKLNVYFIQLCSLKITLLSEIPPPPWIISSLKQPLKVNILINTHAGQWDRVLWDGEDVLSDGDHVAGLPVGLHLRTQRGVPVEALHTLDPTEGLGAVDSVSIVRYFILIPLQHPFTSIIILIFYEMHLWH